MKTKICIVRHGETDWNAVGRLQGSMDIALNETGLNQARECAHALQDQHFDVIITSPLKRAKQTASVIHEQLGVPMVVADEFIEMHFGKGEGLTLEERQSAFPNQLIYPGQESLESLTKRIVSGLHRIVEEYDGQSICLVAHGRVINDLLNIVSNGDLSGGKLGLVNGCISRIEWDSGIWTVCDFNNIDHLSHFSDIGRI